MDRRTQLLNQLTRLRKTSYAQALQLLDSLTTELAADFLTRWPDLLARKTATRAPYDEARYLRQLLKRKSPHALPA